MLDAGDRHGGRIEDAAHFGLEVGGQGSLRVGVAGSAGRVAQ
jgi:hypothetical protein